MHTYGIYKDGTDEPSNGDADMENRLVDKMVEREGGTNWKSSTETNSLLYVK